MKRGFNRTQRVADLIQKALANLLLQEGHSLFHLVTITSVTVTRDLSYAKIYVSVLMDDDIQIKRVVKELNNAAKSLRYQLAREVILRVMPELKFVYDESTAHGFHLSTLIDKAIKKTGGKST